MTRILVVEDNEMNRDMLSRRGHEVLVAVDGAPGVAMAASEQPDIVLVDMRLPVLDGWEATRQLKADAGNRRNSPSSHLPHMRSTPTGRKR